MEIKIDTSKKVKNTNNLQYYLLESLEKIDSLKIEVDNGRVIYANKCRNTDEDLFGVTCQLESNDTLTFEKVSISQVDKLIINLVEMNFAKNQNKNI